MDVLQNLDVIQKKTTSLKVGKRWLTRSLSVALVGAILLPVGFEASGASAVSAVVSARQGPSRSVIAKRALAVKKTLARSAVRTNARAKSNSGKSVSTKRLVETL